MEKPDVTSAIDGADNDAATRDGAHGAGQRYLFAVPVELRHLKRPADIS